MLDRLSGSGSGKKIKIGKSFFVIVACFWVFWVFGFFVFLDKQSYVSTAQYLTCLKQPNGKGKGPICVCQFFYFSILL